jgi:hypothetical protein
MEKVSSVFSYQLMGNLQINPGGEKPSFVSSTLENKVNYFVVLDHEQGVPGTPPVPKFCYYPVKMEIVGSRLFIRKFPGLLVDGILMLARKKAIEVTIDEITRGRILLGDRVIDFADLEERYASLIAEAPERVTEDRLSEVSLFTYSVNPQAYWQ